MEKETQELVQNAQKKEYMDFKEKALETLKQKAAEKISEQGYFDRLNNAKGIFEDQNPFGKKDKDDSEDSKDKDKDKDDSKDKDKVNEKYDIVDFIMDYEGGNLSDDDTVKGFSKLMKQGLHTQLQGHYGRMAKSLVDAGYLDKKGNIKMLPSEG